MRHVSAPPFASRDGSYWARCECGFESGPFFDMESVVDSLMEHAAYGAINPVAVEGEGR